MASKRYENNAWVDIDELKRYENGAWVDCESAKKYENGAWVEVWTAVQWLKQLANTTTADAINYVTLSNRENVGWSIFATTPQSGYVTYYLDGLFTNPEVSCEYDGIYYGMVSGTQKYAPAGSISLYTRTTSGTENYTSLGNLGDSSGETFGEYFTTLSGSFNRIGYKIKLNNWQLDAPIMYWIDIWDFMIDGKLCLPGEDCIV